MITKKETIKKADVMRLAEKAAFYSTKKYAKTYELLAKYGKSEQDAPVLAGSEDIRGYFRKE